MMRWVSVAAALVMLGGCGESGSQSAGAESAVHPGEQTYTRYCFSCHAGGIAGAPRVGDAGQWAPRIAKGVDALLASSIKGVPPGMPARGLCSQCTDQDLADAIDFMISKSR